MILTKSKGMALVVLALLSISADVGGSASPSTDRDEEDKMSLSLAPGLELLGEASYKEARKYFTQLLRKESLDPSVRSEAVFWLIRTDMVLGRIREAEILADDFLVRFPDSSHYHAVLYEKGRLIYLGGDFQGALGVFARYRKEFSIWEYVANSLYWSGMAHYNLGEFEEAYHYFYKVVMEHPGSLKVDDAVAMMVRIDQEEQQREVVSLDDEVVEQEDEPPLAEPSPEEPSPEEVSREDDYKRKLIEMRNRADALEEFYRELLTDKVDQKESVINSDASTEERGR